MPRTVEHIIHTHEIARERQAQGKPIWDRHVNVAKAFEDYDSDDIDTVVPMRDALVAILKESAWFKESEDLPEVVDELEGVDTPEYFASVWDAIYDIADVERVWIETHKVPAS